MTGLIYIHKSLSVCILHFVFIDSVRSVFASSKLLDVWGCIRFSPPFATYLPFRYQEYHNEPQNLLILSAILDILQKIILGKSVSSVYPWHVVCLTILLVVQLVVFCFTELHNAFILTFLIIFPLCTPFTYYYGCHYFHFCVSLGFNSYKHWDICICTFYLICIPYHVVAFFSHHIWTVMIHQTVGCKNLRCFYILICF